MSWYVGAVLLLLVALLLDLGLLAYAMYVLLTLLIGSRLLANWWIEGLSAERECNTLTAEVGDRVAVVVTVRNAGSLPVAWVLMEDALPRDALRFDPPRLRLEGRRLGLAWLAPGRSARLLYQLQCNCRGYYQLGPLVLETGDLFGLHRRWRIASKPHFLLVYPRVIALEGYDVASRRPIGEVRMTYRLFEDPTRIAGVRGYQRGDPLHRIHWRATARTGVLHSKEYEPSTVAGATLVVDFHQASHAAKDEPVRSELAITTAASLAHALYEMGQQVGLVSNGRDAADRVRQQGWDQPLRSRRAAQQAASMRERSDRLAPVIVPTRRGPQTLREIFDSLARLELTDGLDLPQLLIEAESRVPRDASVIVILPRVTVADAIALGGLARRGFEITALINVWDEYEYSGAAGPLVAQGIDVHHLKDEQSVPYVCRQYLVR